MKQDAYKKARKRVKAKKGFFGHLSAYIAVGLFFFFINVADGLHDVWFFYPILPWGIALTIHYFAVFGLPGTDVMTKEWEDREMAKELRRYGYEPEDMERNEDYLPEDYLPEEEELEEDEELDLREIRRERQQRGLADDDFV